MNTISKLDRVTGPLSRKEFEECVRAPYGEAVKVIRRYDPQYGRAPGEKFPWKVKCRCEMYGEAIVMAADEKEANKLADELTDAAVDWMYGHESELEVTSVEPDKIPR